jgi:hypothetical protein
VAQALILAGKVRSGPDSVVNKPAQSSPEDAVLTGGFNRQDLFLEVARN